MLGENLKRLMKEKKVTSRKLAAAIKISEPYVSYMLTGKKTPSLPMIERIADFLGVTPDVLIMRKQPPSPNGREALAEKYESILLAMESMQPELVAVLTVQIEAAANLCPRRDVSEKNSQDDASYSRKKKPG